MTAEEGPWSAPPDSQSDWSAATRDLSRRDPVLGALIRRIGPCTLAPRPNSFGTLVGSIVAQQISAAAARTIHKRLWALTRGEPPGPRDILRRRKTTLRRVGLSRQKIAYLRDLAARVESGELDLAALDRGQGNPTGGRRTGLRAAALTAVKGIGNWTADMHIAHLHPEPAGHAKDEASRRRGSATPRCSQAMRDL